MSESSSVPWAAAALTEDTSSFWTGGARGALLINRCNACRNYVHPPAPVCRSCRSVDVTACPVSGRGTVVSYTVNHQPWSDGYNGPYVVALVGLEEQSGLNLVTNIVGCESSAVQIGMPVEVAFEPVGETWLPVFRPRA